MLRYALQKKIGIDHTEDLYGHYEYFPALVARRRMGFLGHASREHYLYENSPSNDPSPRICTTVQKKGGGGGAEREGGGAWGGGKEGPL